MSHNEGESLRHEAMMSPMDLTDMGSNMTALIHGVMQTNLRTMLEYSRVDSPEAFVDLQRRFAREYLAALQHGIMMLVSAVNPGRTEGSVDVEPLPRPLRPQAAADRRSVGADA